MQKLDSECLFVLVISLCRSLSLCMRLSVSDPTYTRLTIQNRLRMGTSQLAAVACRAAWGIEYEHEGFFRELSEEAAVVV